MYMVKQKDLSILITLLDLDFWREMKTENEWNVQWKEELKRLLFYTLLRMRRTCPSI